jgi:hypothetical protein
MEQVQKGEENCLLNMKTIGSPSYSVLARHLTSRFDPASTQHTSTPLVASFVIYQFHHFFHAFLSLCSMMTMPMMYSMPWYVYVCIMFRWGAVWLAYWWCLCRSFGLAQWCFICWACQLLCCMISPHLVDWGDPRHKVVFGTKHGSRYEGEQQRNNVLKRSPNKSQSKMHVYMIDSFP